MIYSLNQKLDRFLIENSANFIDKKNEILSGSKITVLSQINSLIIDVCQAKLSTEINTIFNDLITRIENIEEQLKILNENKPYFGIPKKNRSKSFGKKMNEEIDCFNFYGIQKELNKKIELMNKDIQNKLEEKIMISIKEEINKFKLQNNSPSNKSTTTSETPTSQHLKSNINVNNHPRHERKSSATKIFSEIFSWGNRNSNISLTSIINDENKKEIPKFEDFFGDNMNDINKVFLEFKINPDFFNRNLTIS